MGTEYLIIILLWCGDPHLGYPNRVNPAVLECRKEALLCASQLERFTTNDVIAKCLK